MIRRTFAAHPFVSLELFEVRAVPFAAYFRERTRRCQKGIRLEVVIANSGRPFHLGCVANEFAFESAICRVGVSDLDSLACATPSHLERNPSRYGRRTATEQRVVDVAVIEDGHIGRLHESAALLQVDFDASAVMPFSGLLVVSLLLMRIIGSNFYRPEQANWWENSRIKVVDLIARTGQIHIHSNESERRLMNSPVRSSEVAFHKPHIGIDERESLLLPSLGVGLRHHAAYVCET